MLFVPLTLIVGFTTLFYFAIHEIKDGVLNHMCRTCPYRLNMATGTLKAEL